MTRIHQGLEALQRRLAAAPGAVGGLLPEVLLAWLLARIHEREHGVEEDRLGAGRDDHILRPDLHAAVPREELGDRVPRVRLSRRGPVVRPSLTEGAARGLHDVGGRVEVRLADLQMEDAAARRLERKGALHDLHGQEGLEGLCAQFRHAGGVALAPVRVKLS